MSNKERIMQKAYGPSGYVSPNQQSQLQKKDRNAANMTITEYAAIQFQASALQGMLASNDFGNIKQTAKFVIEYAEALLKECGYVD